LRTISISHPLIDRLILAINLLFGSQEWQKLRIASVTLLLLISSITLSPSLYGDASAQANSNTNFEITHGIASGDVTDNSAIIWSRVNDQPAQMNVEYDTSANFTNPLSKTAQGNSTTDFTAHAKLDGLKSNTRYYYRVWFTAPGLVNNNNSETNNNLLATTNIAEHMEFGTFRTAPSASMSNNGTSTISFIWGGDLGGQNYCRNADEGGYSIFEFMQWLNPDFFIANGDSIYADGVCHVQGPILNDNGEEGNRSDANSQNVNWTNISGDFKSVADPSVDWNNITEVRSIFVEHWKYNRNDTYFKEFLRNVPMYSQWDDHEVIEDFGYTWPYRNLFNVSREGYPTMANEGRNAFLYYSPLDSDANNNDDTANDQDEHIYRSFNWGEDLDLFLIDGRSYRSQNHLADTPDSNKTMLGERQLAWLKEEVINSNATWKIISSNVPISIPTGNDASILGRDGWANGNETNNYSYYTGFERELADIFKLIDEQNIKNIVFITTDVHFPAFIKYNFDLNNDGDMAEIYEFISGPLSALREESSLTLDEAFNPSLLYTEDDIFNFGYVRIGKYNDTDKSHLIVEILDENGIVRPGSTLDLVPQ
jgi:alkaline phosphatase D